jgi:predicted enzyme related to lactoylglutathione lyase
MKRIIIVLTAAISFISGIAFTQALNNHKNSHTMPKVTGIGGVFFKCKDPEKVRQWYSKHLGLQTDKYGTNFEWREGADSSKKGYTQWSPFKETTKYFGEGTQDFMINYRVTDLEALVAQLKQAGVTIVDNIETVDYGKFVHIVDIEGNRVELWEPVDEVYDTMVEGRTK